MVHRRPTLLHQVIFYRWPWRLLILFCSLASAAAGLAAPWFQKEFIDTLTGRHSPVHLTWFDQAAPWILLSFLGMLLAQGLAQLTNFLGSREALFLQRKFSEQLYAQMLTLRADTRSRGSIGETVSLYATDVPGATVFLDQTLPMGSATLFPLILAPFAISTFFQTPIWGTTLLILLVVAINTALAFRQSRYFYLFKQLAAERTGLVNEWIQNIRTLRILGWTRAFEHSIFQKREAETENRVQMVTNGQVMNSISTSITFFLNIATLGTLTLFSRQTLTPGEILALLWILGVFLTRPFRQMPWFFTFAFDAWTSTRRLQAFLQTTNQQTKPTAKTLPPADPTASLEVRHLRLEVQGQTLLNDLNFVVHPGEFLAIVGEVGSGKSLLLLSLMRETGAAFDRYTINGEDTKNWSDEKIRSMFSYVPQEGFIISAQLRENVVFDYSPDLNLDSQVLKSLKAAEFDLDRERVDKGLETEIGERGVNLSGGQRQRVSLSRAHFADRGMLLLDDCLSAVDVETEEKLVSHLLNGEWKNRTKILVTHRLTVLDKVDRILFLKNGAIWAEGTWQDLIRSCAEFREFTTSVLQNIEDPPATPNPHRPAVTLEGEDA